MSVYLPYTTVRDCEYNDAENNHIHMYVKFDHLTAEVAFNATNDDPWDHGRELWARAHNGDFGPIAPFGTTIARS